MGRSRRGGGLRAHRRGVTLVSVVIGIALVALLLVTNFATLVYAAQTARINSYRLAARNVVQGVLEQMYAYPYGEVTPANFPSIPMSNPNAMVLDALNGLVCDLAVEFEGERSVTAATGNTLTSAGATWEANRWAGNAVMIASGRGLGQRARILSNTADTLTTELLGIPGHTAWMTVPDATSTFLINGGKTVRVSASFEFRGRTYTESVAGLVVHDD